MNKPLNPDALPDLYVALASIVMCASKLQSFRGPAGQGLIAKCNAALAKARGEQP